MSSSESSDPLNTSQPVAPEAAGSAAAPPEAAPSDPVETAKKEASENYNRYLRAVADLENFRRRTVREKDELRQYAAGGVLEDLLPVVDNLTLAIAASRQPNADLKNLTGGVDMVLTQLKTALASHGLKEVNPAGQSFDANLHESISAQPSAEIPEGHVTTVVRPGFTLNGRLLRPASVIVSSGSAKADGAQG